MLKTMKAVTKHRILTNTLECEWPILREQRKEDDTNSTQQKQQQQSPSVTFVISHCNHDLDWFMDFITDVNWIKHIMIYSKCGHDIVGLSIINSSIITTTNGIPVDIMKIENLGRNDQTYLYHILQRLRYEQNHTSSQMDSNQENEYVVFLKDNRGTADDLGARWRSLADMMTLQEHHGFACALDYRFFNELYFTQYHYQLYLRYFNLTEHIIHENRYQNVSSQSSNVTFKSRFPSLKDWFRCLLIKIPQVIPVCYGGSFMTSMSSVRKVKLHKWERLLRLLSRGDNIEEGHYMERTWAAILSRPISPCVVDKLVFATRTLIKYGPNAGGLLVEVNRTIAGKYIMI